jgi:hypothetical protein
LFRFLCNDSQHHVFSLDAPFQMLSAHNLSTHLCFFPYMSTLVRGHGPHYTWLFFLAIPTARRSLYVIQAL